MVNQWKNFSKGLFKENPVFVLLLGLCPVLGVTSSAINGVGMGLATTFVLVMANIVVSLIKNFIPDKVRIPAFIVVIASFVTIVDLLMQGYLQSLHEQLGLFIPLIVVNCIVLGRAEAFASKNNVISTIFDCLGMGLGFTLALTILGSIREILGSGSIFGFELKFKFSNYIISLFPLDDKGHQISIIVFVLAPGAFFVLGYLIAIARKINK